MSLIDESEKKVKEGFIGQKMIVLPPNVKRIISKNELIKQFYVTAIGFYPHAAFHNRERKFGCNQYIFLYCTAGSGLVIIKGETLHLKPNEFIILPCNVPHQYASSKEDPWSIYWMHITGENAALFYSRYLSLKSVPSFTAYDPVRIETFDHIFSLLENSFEERCLEFVSIKLQEFISGFLYPEQLKPSTQSGDKISDSILFMKKNINRQFSVQDLAQQQNLSVTHYSRVFRAKTGSSPNQYFSELKVQKSCQYLYFTDRSLKEICVELGFRDPYYFSRLFKKLMGVSPVKYKNKYKRN